jgi:hypothetical protein
LLVGRSDVPDQVSLYLVAREAVPGGVLRLAAEADCMFAIDTGTHAPGQLGWLGNGCTRADRFGISPNRVINARCTDDLASVAGRWPAWARRACSAHLITAARKALGGKVDRGLARP